MVSIDIYVNETTRHADVILPAPSPLEQSHYDLALYQLAVRNVANYSPPVFEPRGDPAEWRALLRLAGDRRRPGAGRRRRRARRLRHPDAVQREVGDRRTRRSPGATRPRSRAELEPRRGPERLLDLMLRAGPYGDGFDASGRTLDVRAARTAIDLGPLEPRLPEVLRTPSGKIELAPEPIVADVDRAARGARRASGTAASCWSAGASCARTTRGCTTCRALVKGKDRCTLHVHPDDAERLGLVDGERGAR